MEFGAATRTVQRRSRTTYVALFAMPQWNEGREEITTDCDRVKGLGPPRALLRGGRRSSRTSSQGMGQSPWDPAAFGAGSVIVFPWHLKRLT